MARISYPDPHELTEQTRERLDRLAPLNIFRMMSHAPGLLDPFVRLGSAFLYDGKLDPVVREIAILRVGYLSNASYETAQHEKIGRDVGMPDDLIDAIKVSGDMTNCSATHKLTVAYTDDLVQNVKASDKLFQEAIDEFGIEQAQELTLIVGYYMMVCSFLETFEIDIEDGGAKGLQMSSADS